MFCFLFYEQIDYVVLALFRFLLKMTCGQCIVFSDDPFSTLTGPIISTTVKFITYNLYSSIGINQSDVNPE